MNVSAALEPQGSFNGRSNVFPNSISSAERGCKNLPSHAQSENTETLSPKNEHEYHIPLLRVSKRAKKDAQEDATHDGRNPQLMGNENKN